MRKSTGLLKNKQYNVYEEILKAILYAHVHVTKIILLSTLKEQTRGWLKNDELIVKWS